MRRLKRISWESFSISKYRVPMFWGLHIWLFFDYWAIMLDLMWEGSIVQGRRWSSQSDQRCKTRRFFKV